MGHANRAHAIVVGAIEEVEGIETMRERRGEMKDRNLTSGPGKLCIAMGIDRRVNGEDMLGEKIWLEDRKRISRGQIAVGKRIGIDYAGDDAEKPWRFWIRDNPNVSKR